MSGDDEPFDILIIPARGDVPKILGLEQPAHPLRLVVSDLQCKNSPWRQNAGRFAHQPPDQIQAVLAAVQRERRVVADFAGQALHVRAGNVWQIRNDEIRRPGDVREQVGPGELNPPGEVVPRRVFRREREGFGRDVASGHGGLRSFQGEAEGDHPASGSHIKGPLKIAGGQHEFHELLGFRARDQRPRVGGESLAEKLDRPEQVLERTPLRTLPDEIAQRSPFLLAQRPLEFEIELDPVLFSEDVGQEVLRIQARAFHALFAKVVRRRGQDFEDRHRLLNCMAERECATDFPPVRAVKAEDSP